MLLWFSICGMAPAVMVVLQQQQQQQNNDDKEGIPVLRNVALQECAQS